MENSETAKNFSVLSYKSCKRKNTCLYPLLLVVRCWVEAISVCNHIICVSKLSCKFIDGVAGSRVLCRVHDGFRSELRRILRITVKCIFMRSPNLENSMRRTVLHNQVIPIFSGDSVLLMPILYTIPAISVNAAIV